MKIKTIIQNSPLWIWVLLPAILFVLAWEPIGVTPLLFIAFLPFLVIHDRLRSGNFWKYFGVLYISILGWNITTTWWVYYASAWGSIAMLILNTLFMCLPFFFLRRIQKGKTYTMGHFFVFTFLWILYEYGHHRWDLSWPWLTLGNAFSASPQWIQWYEFTGTLGGSLWILWSNIFLYLYFFYDKSEMLKRFFVLSLVLIIISGILYLRVNIKDGKEVKVALLQPSFNPWNEKFDRDPMDMQREMLSISKNAIDRSTDWLLWPETCLVSSIDVDQVNNNPQILQLQEALLDSFSQLQLLSGFHGVRYYQSQIKPTRSARVSAYDPGIFYDVYNSALWLKKDSLSRYYHKSKLVPGTEQMPFIHTIPFLESLAISLDENSITGSLGVSDSAYALGSEDPVAPIICYESIYGDYVRGYLKRGATWLGIVTNDAWWENTAGHKQHFSYARLRAIEFRKWIGRSANTGITGFIDPKGETYQKTDWYQKICIQQEIYANNYKTIYYFIGDIGILMMYVMLILVIWFLKSKGFLLSKP